MALPDRDTGPDVLLKSWSTRLKALSPPVLMVGGSKLTGVVRDVLIVSAFGFTATGDALIFAMATVSFLQAIAYRGGINRLGSAREILAVLGVGSRLSALLLSVAVLQGVGLASVREEPGLLDMVMLFLPLAPLAVLNGMGAATAVARGDRTALVKVAVTQNLVLIGAVPVVAAFATPRWLAAAWFVSVSGGLLTARKLVRASASSPDAVAQRAVPAYDIAVLSPAFFFAAVLAERYFFTLATGSLVLVRLLETAVASIIFLLEVTVLNRRIAMMRDLAEGGKSPREAGLTLKSGLIRSLLAGSALYALFAFGLLVLIEFRIPPLHDLPPSVRDFVAVLALLYGVHFLLSTACEYQDRYLFVNSLGRHVLLMNGSALLLTIGLNGPFLPLVPYSVIVISIVLKVGRLSWGALLRPPSSRL